MTAEEIAIWHADRGGAQPRGDSSTRVPLTFGKRLPPKPDAREAHADAFMRRRGRVRKRPYRPLAPLSSPVVAVEKSMGSKIGPVSATYVAQQTCPTSCPFLQAGCYAENGFMGGFITKRLNRYGERDPLTIAEHEARAIDRLSGDRDLRLHVVGDSPTIQGTREIAGAALRFVQRGGKRVWTYTHAWRDVPREAWGSVSVLASCETPADVAAARARGYASAITVPLHTTHKRHDERGISVLPCPEQTRGVTCADCRLCLDDRRLLSGGISIAFALHGGRGSLSKARRAIAGSVS